MTVCQPTGTKQITVAVGRLMLPRLYYFDGLHDEVKLATCCAAKGPASASARWSLNTLRVGTVSEASTEADDAEHEETDFVSPDPGRRILRFGTLIGAEPYQDETHVAGSRLTDLIIDGREVVDVFGGLDKFPIRDTDNSLPPDFANFPKSVLCSLGWTRLDCGVLPASAR